MKRTVTLTNTEIEFIMQYMNGDDYCFKKSNNKVTGNVSWNMFVNRKVLADAAAKIDEFRTEINNSYISDEKSYVTKDNDGNDVRRVKEEYADQYQDEIEALGRQKMDLTFDTISMEDLKTYTLDDIDYTMIGYLIEENEDYVGPGHEKGQQAVEVVED